MTDHDTAPFRRNSASRWTPLLTRGEAAGYLGVSTRIFDRMRKEAVIPYVTIGKRRKYLLRDLEAFLQAQRSV